MMENENGEQKYIENVGDNNAENGIVLGCV